MAAKKNLLEQNQEFEAVLGQEYRRAGGVSQQFADSLKPLNRSSSPTPKVSGTSSVRQLAKRLVRKK